MEMMKIDVLKILTFTEKHPNVEPIQWQNGLVSQVGVNGYQVIDVLEETIQKLEHWDRQLPCDENKYTIEALKEAIRWQEERTKDRELRGVESGYKE